MKEDAPIFKPELVDYPILMDIKLNLKTLSLEQAHILQKLNELEERGKANGDEIKKLKKTLDDFAKVEEVKKDMRATLLIWLRIGGMVAVLLTGLISYLAYETALYKPIPRHHTQRK